MFFVLSKIFWTAAQPFSLVCILLLVGTAAVWTGWRRLGLALLTATVGLVAITGFTNLGGILLSPLEDRFPAPAAAPAHVDGIVVLGGFLDGYVDAKRGGYELDAAADRIVETLRLAMRYPDARVIVSGGTGDLIVNSEGDATGAERFFAAFGLSGSHFEYDTRSRNTWQNALYSRELARPGPNQTWLLVTSAWHMPRAVGCFRRAGFAVVPWPVDYRTGPREGFAISGDALGGMSLTTLALKEWIGLAAYDVTGRSSALFPAP
jgi:uncharacterized SAM-binding protein YcdF (DUF218 family)